MMLEIKFKVQIIEVSAGVARLADVADATFLGYDQPPSQTLRCISRYTLPLSTSNSAGVTSLSVLLSEVQGLSASARCAETLAVGQEGVLWLVSF